MKKLFSLVLILFSAYNIFAQCDCDQTISSSIWNGGFTFQSNKNYCIQGNITIRYNVTFQNNTSVCILPGSTLKIDNTIYGNANSEVTINVYGDLVIPNNIPFGLNLNIMEGGSVRGLYGEWQDFNIHGRYFNLDIESDGSYLMGNLNFHNSKSNTIKNDGEFIINGEIAMRNESASVQLFNYNLASLTGNLNFTQGGLNLFENYGTFNCNGIYSTDPTLHLKNDGDMTTRENYDDTVGSNFSNCGTLRMSRNWANLQGRIINTGNMIVTESSIAFTSTGRVDNYSVMHLYGVTMNEEGAIFYNEGEVTFETNEVYNVKFYGPESNQQPDHSTSTNYGRFKWPGVSNGAAVVRGNLNLVNTNGKSNKHGMFGNNAITSDNNKVRYGKCNPCVVITEYDHCPNADGTWPVSGVNCIPVNRHVRTQL